MARMEKHDNYLPWMASRRIGLAHVAMAAWRVDSDNYLGTNPGGTLGAAGLLVDPSLPDGQAAKSCITAMAVMYPLMDGLSVEQEH